MSEILREILSTLRQVPGVILATDLTEYDLGWMEGNCHELYRLIKLKESEIENTMEISVKDLTKLICQWVSMIEEGHQRQKNFDSGRWFDKDFPHSWYERR